MRHVLLFTAACAAAAALPVDLARADAQLHVTARVVNRCTIELPPPARWDVPPGQWRRWVRHGCDFPVRPRMTLRRMAQPDWRPDVGWQRRDRYFLITVTY